MHTSDARVGVVVTKRIYWIMYTLFGRAWEGRRNNMWSVGTGGSFTRVWKTFMVENGSIIFDFPLVAQAVCGHMCCFRCLAA